MRRRRGGRVLGGEIGAGGGGGQTGKPAAYRLGGDHELVLGAHARAVDLPRVVDLLRDLHLASGGAEPPGGAFLLIVPPYVRLRVRHRQVHLQTTLPLRIQTSVDILVSQVLGKLQVGHGAACAFGWPAAELRLSPALIAAPMTGVCDPSTKPPTAAGTLIGVYFLLCATAKLL